MALPLHYSWDVDVEACSLLGQAAGGVANFLTDSRRGAGLLVQFDDYCCCRRRDLRSIPIHSRARAIFQISLLKLSSGMRQLG